MELILASIPLAGLIASVVGFVARQRRRLRSRRVDDELRGFLRRLFRFERRIAALGADTFRIRHGCLPSTGSESAEGHLRYLVGTVDELDRTMAEVNAMTAAGATTALQRDVASLAAVLRRAAATYFVMIPTEVEEWCADQRDFTATYIPDVTDQSGELRRLKLEATTLFRRIAYRSGVRNMAEVFRCIWPATTTEAGRIDCEAVWASEPRPLSWARA